MGGRGRERVRRLFAPERFARAVLAEYGRAV
jgi:hypothetical protein